MSERMYVRLPKSGYPERLRPVYGVTDSRSVVTLGDDGMVAEFALSLCAGVTAAVSHCDLCGEPYELRELRDTDDGVLLCPTCDATPAVVDPTCCGHRFERDPHGWWQCVICQLVIPRCAGTAAGVAR